LGHIQVLELLADQVAGNVEVLVLFPQQFVQALTFKETMVVAIAYQPKVVEAVALVQQDLVVTMQHLAAKAD
jgi:hypothetical protein